MDAHQTGHAEPVWLSDRPAYRVDFWKRPKPNFGFNLDAYILIDAIDVEEVLRWVAENARGREYELFVEVEPADPEPGLRPRSATLVRLAGANPNEFDTERD
jgi:hypothetical protein